MALVLNLGRLFGFHAWLGLFRLWQRGSRPVEQLNTLTIVELALVVLTQVSIQPSQLGTHHSTRTLALARFEIFLCLAPVGVAQCQTPQSQQQVGIIGTLLQPLFSMDQLTCRIDA